MSNENTPHQFDMFLKDYVDNRSTGQKRQDRGRQSLQQSALFSINDMLQLGANAKPWLNEMPRPPLELEIQEVRTEEQIERDRRREAEALTAQMFSDQSAPQVEPKPDNGLIDDRQAIDYRVALFYLGKGEMVAVRPDLKAQIDQLVDTEIEEIACQIEATLEAVYQLILTATVGTYCAQKELGQAVKDPAPSTSMPAEVKNIGDNDADEQTLLPINLPTMHPQLPVLLQKI